MNRCGIRRKDGITRVAVLCESCTARAIKKVVSDQTNLWVRRFDGSTRCEACNETDCKTAEGEQL